jgi:hypothetical protein
VDRGRVPDPDRPDAVRQLQHLVLLDVVRENDLEDAEDLDAAVAPDLSEVRDRAHPLLRLLALREEQDRPLLRLVGVEV